MKICNFGSLNLDRVYTVSHMAQPGETLASSTMEEFCGGKGLNQSLALARAGRRFSMPAASARTEVGCGSCWKEAGWTSVLSTRPKEQMAMPLSR